MIREEGGFLSMKLNWGAFVRTRSRSPIVRLHVFVLELTHIGKDQVVGREVPTRALQRCWCLTATIRVI